MTFVVSNALYSQNVNNVHERVIEYLFGHIVFVIKISVTDRLYVVQYIPIYIIHTVIAGVDACGVILLNIFFFFTNLSLAN